VAKLSKDVTAAELAHFRVLIERSYSRMTDSFFVVARHSSTNELYALKNDGSWSKQTEGAYVVDPFLEVRIDQREDFTQSLMDQLWNLGIRPSGRPDTEPIVTAKDEHIRDLRNIVTALLPKKRE